MVDAVDRHHTIGYLSNSKLIQGWPLVYIRTPAKQEKKTANPDRKMMYGRATYWFTIFTTVKAQQVLVNITKNETVPHTLNW